jgi:glucans biosynthesis protein
MPIHRTAFLTIALLLAPLAARAGFDLAAVAEQARRLAARPYEAPPASRHPRLAELSYDDYRDIRFRPQASVWRTEGLPFELQFFHAGRGFAHPVRLHEVVDGTERPLALPRGAFDYGRAAPAVAGAAAAEVVGFRVHTALGNPAYKDELVAFLGASYFRALGAGQQYGLSARAIAVDTTGGRGEEFPAFEAFWLERPAPGATTLTVYALLNGPRVAGAYRFVFRPGAQTEVEVAARLYLRGPVATLGLAPLTSMYLGGENDPASLQAAGDFRPEVHDSDGLQVESADGEWLWRPLQNPPGTFVTSLALRGVRGFGLMQRDRRFASYEDPEANYHRRPSVWIVPQGDWGPGRVELLQFATPDETHDNVAAYWVPERLPAPGEPLAYAYTMRWQGDGWQRPPAGWVEQTRFGRSHAEPVPGESQFTLDHAGAALEALPDDAAPQAEVNAGDNARVLLANVERLPHTRGWRLTLKIQRLDPSRPVELRAYLRRGNDVLTETWTYALPPN